MPEWVVDFSSFWNKNTEIIPQMYDFGKWKVPQRLTCHLLLVVIRHEEQKVEFFAGGLWKTQ